MSTEETCPHLAPIQVTLDLLDGDLTLRHTECGLPVAADWTDLRAHQLPLTLVYARDDADEDWLELKLPAGLDEWLADEQPQDERDALAEVTAELDAANDDANRIAEQRTAYREEIMRLRARVRELEDAQPERDGDGDVRAVAAELRQEFGVQAEHSTSAFPTRTEQVARDLAASYSRVREPGCNPTPHYPVTRFSSDWQRLPDEPTAELDARGAKGGE